MFVGHYSIALALKRAEKDAPLGWLFLGVQLVDIAFFTFVLLGVERLNIVENFTPSTHFELEFLPYTHSLVGSLVWAGAVYLLLAYLPIRQLNKRRVALVVAVAVLSHWILDLVVHTPDLPLLGDNSPKVGLGLWNNAYATIVVEAALLLAGLWLYLRRTVGTSAAGRYGMVLFAIFLIVVNVVNILGPPPDSANFLAVLSLLLYFAFAAAAFWLDRQRA